MSESDNNELLTELTAEIVSAYVSNNPISASELPDLIGTVHDRLKTLAASRRVGRKLTSPTNPLTSPKTPPLTPSLPSHVQTAHVWT